VIRTLTGDCREVLKGLKDESVHCVVTSPPYWNLRDYGVDGQIGLEGTPQEYVAALVGVFREVRRVLHSSGVVFLNLGDTYAGGGRGRGDKGYAGPIQSTNAGSVYLERCPDVGVRPKNLMMIPARVAMALQDDDWIIRSEIVWAKKAPMPESVTDRCTRSHEMVYMLAKSPRYFCDMEAVKEESACTARPETSRNHNGTKSSDTGNHANGGTLGWNRPENGRNLRDVWPLGPEPFSAVKSARRVRVASDELDGDTIRITSPDCPVHGHLEIAGGEHAVGSLSHNGHNGGRRAPKRRASPAPSSSNSEYGHQAQSSGLPLLEYSGVAMPHSTQSHKTDPAPVTSPSCTPCEQTAFHTGDTSRLRDPGDDGQHNHESKSAGDSGADGKGSCPLAETSCHNADTLDSLLVPPGCTCSFYKEITEESNHFAVFPTELARRCIAMGTSEKGCCSRCGAPWERIVTKPDMSQRPTRGNEAKMNTDAVHISNGWADYPKSAGQAYQEWRNDNPNVTTGWRPTCECQAEPRPCVVLDPFAGSGTVGLVADRMGRDAILIDLNPEYSAMQRERVTQDAPLFAAVTQ